MRLNKKAQAYKFFGFFFIISIVSALMMFLGVGMHFIAYDYGVTQAVDIGVDVVNRTGNVNTSGAFYTGITGMQTKFFDLSGVYDWLFLLTMVSLFIESCIAATKTKRLGWFSFMGLVTFGNLLLIMVIFFSIQIRDWFMTEVFYKIITETFDSMWMTYFFDNTYWILFLWYLIILVLSIVDFKQIRSSLGFGEGSSSDDRFEGRFEE